ncbi:Two component regulator three Y domain-containing protein [Leptospira fletcheri]|uniref:Two component regulator three Y domain-containing protein n=1 Tax=Leptospira fletcheri TaxID=2484981 RepID=A0A4R9GDS2_9LEPT|nr:accessory Sec system protein Asp2 [Leptospira fletcheri]TGK09952.1 Two component regulator three Y domain-containing protein [Leptospira fletcheri]
MNLDISKYTDEQGRDFFYIFRKKPGVRTLVIHFTAFFGDWGDRKEYKENYQGYFHRLKMLGDQREFNSLFLCDQFGFTKNGTYYTGEHGDFFVERAMLKMIQSILNENGISNQDLITIGSSMGATAALKFGLIFNAKGIVCISPHIDLDICAEKQGRYKHVAFICPDGDPMSENNFKYTRQVARLLNEWNRAKNLPILFIHSCEDDYGVHAEQVIPIVDRWKSLGGNVYADFRPTGGHGSDYCTKPVILDVIQKMIKKREIRPKEYLSYKYLPEVEKNYRNKMLFLLRSVLSKLRLLSLVRKIRSRFRDWN